MIKLVVIGFFLLVSAFTANAQPGSGMGGGGGGYHCGPRCQQQAAQAAAAANWRARQAWRAQQVYVQPAPVVVAAQPPVYAGNGIPQARTGGFVVPGGTVVQPYQFYGWCAGQRCLLTQPGFVAAPGGTVVPAYPPPSAVGYTLGQQAAYGASTVVQLPGRIIGGAANVVGGVVGGAVGGLFGAFGY